MKHTGNTWLYPVHARPRVHLGLVLMILALFIPGCLVNQTAVQGKSWASEIDSAMNAADHGGDSIAGEWNGVSRDYPGKNLWSPWVMEINVLGNDNVEAKVWPVIMGRRSERVAETHRGTLKGDVLELFRGSKETKWATFRLSSNRAAATGTTQGRDGERECKMMRAEMKREPK